ncbi:MULTISPECIES: tetratricopeptide repeat protein [unclassified Sphingobacterium]|uniref:tetratricopeptide repeat protein n=1 Tax=unclassified Sphingobacterium TaxID=2609468 RepID=UPI002954C181|nr:tetratricopeptide repeat protein [Sphingobacterium sp. UGAL515B_05]WON94252.1 sel1 repeat family protein [Sphingobacterium sp. UGAL515B_05]
MKGQKQLEMAKGIGYKINEYPSYISFEDKKEMYDGYSELVKKSAYTGNPEAQYCYAQLFDTMTYVALENPLCNPKKCIYWYTKSAEGGYAEAYNNLADFYERGIGVKQDLKKSYELYKKGAELGSPTAKSNLKIFEKDLKKGKYSL